MMIATSLVLATVAMLLAWRWVDGKARVDADTVVVAARDIDLGSRLAPEMLQVVKWPRGSVPDGAFATVDPLLKEATTGEPRVVMAGVLRGEPVLPARLAPVGAKAGLAAVIAQGMRAITVRVNDVVGVAGFALPGSYVDVLVNTTAGASGAAQSEKSISKIVLDHILVLAVAQEVARDETKPKVVNAVTLEVTPEQAERIDLARSVGTLSLVLRNQIDTQALASTGITKQQLLRTAEEPEAPAAVLHRASPPTRARAVAVAQDRVEVIRGIERTSREFPMEGSRGTEESHP